MHALARRTSQRGLMMGLAALAVVVGLAIARLPLTELMLVSAGAAVVVAGFAEPLLGLCAALLVGPTRAWLEIVRPGIAQHAGQAVLMVVLITWMARKLVARDWRLAAPPLTWFLLAFLAVGLVSLWAPFDIWAGMLELAKWVQLLLVALLVMDRLAAPGTEQGRARVAGLAVAGIGASGVSQALIGIWQFALRGDGVEAFAINDRWYRAYGTFQQPNPYAGLLGLTGALIVGLVVGTWADALCRPGLHVRDLRTRALWRRAPALATSALAAALIVIGLIASWSRGGWMGFAASIAIVAVLLPRRGSWGLILVALVVVAGVVLYAQDLLPAAIEARLTGFAAYVRFEDVRGLGITDDNFSVIERMAHWQAGLEMWRARFWRGVGLGCYEAAYPAYRLINWPLPLGHAHNFYLNLLAETGLPGLAVYLGWQGAQAAALVVATRRLSGWRRGLAIGCAAAWTHFAAHSLVDNLLVNNVHLHVGVLVALTVWVVAQRQPGELADQRRGVLARIP